LPGRCHTTKGETGMIRPEIFTTKTWARAILLLCSIAFCLHFPAMAEEIKDRDISLAVDKALIDDPCVSSHLIDIWVDSGVVSLTGSVDNLLARDRATKVAQRIKGVRAAVNRIKVKYGPAH